MTKKSPPKIDSRTAKEIVQQVKALLNVYAPNWREDPLNPVTGKPEGISTALLNIFTRFAEIIIERLNQVPDKNFLAFLNLLGASRFPPQPARVPLTFSLASGSTVDAIVPAGTQVAAPPAEGEKDPIIFETEQELVVAATQLESLWVSDPNQDQYGNFSILTKVTDSSEPVPIFRGNQSNPHIFYLAHRVLLGFPAISSLTLDVTLASTGILEDERILQWEFWDGTQWQETQPTDGTDHLKNSGTNTIEFDLSNLDNGIPVSSVNSVENRWLRCKLLTPIARTDPPENFQDAPHSGMVRENHLPEINDITMEVELSDTDLLPELAFANAAPVAIGQPFFPFGETPKFNDALYLAHAEAFSKDATLAQNDQGAEITLAIDLENPWWDTTITRKVHSDYDLQLSWECWNGTIWQEVGVTPPPDWWHLIEVNPLPSLIPPPASNTEPTAVSVTVQGIAKQGAAIAINRRGETSNGETGNDQSLSALLREDGRFAAAIQLLEGINIITCTARYQGKENRSWLVIFREAVSNSQIFFLEVTSPPPVEADQNQVTLEVTVIEPVEQQLIQSIQVTNGRTNISVSQPKNSNTPTPIIIDLETGFNDLLIEGLEGADPSTSSTLAATTLTVIRKAPTPTSTSAFIDGTYGLRQSGDVTLTLPQKVKKTAINGQENYWLRIRLKSGDYGKEAAYQLANPLNPAEGFILMPATFRPPIIEQIKIGYEQTLTDSPEKYLTYNNLVFKDETKTIEEDGSFKPFFPCPENFPTLYLGFTLPVNRADFPNKKLSLFFHIADLQYGKKLTPISPISSRASQQAEITIADSAETYVPHRFELAGTNLLSGTFKIVVLGTTWGTALWDVTETPAVRIDYDLNLMSVETVAALPAAGKGLVIVAKIGDFYHVRIFDRNGNRVIDKGNGEFIPDGELAQQLEDAFINLPIDNPTKSKLIRKITSNLGHILDDPEITLEPNTVQTVEVRVTVGTGSHDRGFIKLSKVPENHDENQNHDENPLEYTAVFETFSGQEIPADDSLELIWQYWNGTDWTRLTVRDDSEKFTRSGLIEFLPPADFVVTQKPDFGFGLSPRYWLRVQWQRGHYSIAPRLQRLLNNTTMAAQTITLRKEILGSSDGSENQTFQTARTPVLKGQKLEVREPEMPSMDEQAAIENEEGQDAISKKLDETGRPKEIWVRWHEVPDFYGSGSRDRHYILNHLSGEIQFGDGRNGLIPPVDTGNLRMARYQSGGGTAGNKPTGAIVQLKTTVPYVEKVTNTEAATGGADAELLDLLLERMPRTIRHRNRAVTLEDYEDLARQASPTVARTKCVPLLNILKNPLEVQNAPLYVQNQEPKVIPKAPGEVSVIIVPRSTEAKPLPSLELISRVQKYLEDYASPTTNISVVGPLYVEVNVTAEIALTSPEGASAVEKTAYQKLANFLHPLTGGLDGTGWDFGREPYKSDFYALIESIPGVSHIRALNVTEVEELPGVKMTARFLVYSGKHAISLVFEES